MILPNQMDFELQRQRKYLMTMSICSFMSLTVVQIWRRMKQSKSYFLATEDFRRNANYCTAGEVICMEGVLLIARDLL